MPHILKYIVSNQIHHHPPQHSYLRRASATAVVLVSNVGVASSDQVTLATSSGNHPAVEVILGVARVCWVVDIDNSGASLGIITVSQAGIEVLDKLARVLLKEVGSAHVNGHLALRVNVISAVA